MFRAGYGTCVIAALVIRALGTFTFAIYLGLALVGSNAPEGFLRARAGDIRDTGS